MWIRIASITLMDKTSWTYSISLKAIVLKVPDPNISPDPYPVEKCKSVGPGSAIPTGKRGDYKQTNLRGLD